MPIPSAERRFHSARDTGVSMDRPDLELLRGAIDMLTGVSMDRPDLELLRGAIDMHAHTAPALFKRHIDDAALAEYAIQFGMRGFVLKDHDASTTGRAYYVNRMHPEVESFGSVVLNRSVGGLSPYVAESAIHYGAKVVWMPSNHSKYHADFFDMPDYPQFGRPRKQLPGEGVTVFEE